MYAKALKLRRKYLKFVATYRGGNEAKFKFQCQSASSQIWFYLYLYWIEINFSSREPGFYKKSFQIHNDTHDDNTFKIIQVPIRNAKCVESFKFQNDAPILKHFPKTLNSCCFSSLASAFASINHNAVANTISTCIEE